MTAVAWFELAAGVGILGFWGFAIPMRRVPEIEEGDRAIWFHIVAEVAIAVALVAGGVGLLVAGPEPWARVVAAAAAGGLAYSTINSPGYYASDGNWGVVGAFGLLTVLGMAAVVVLVIG